MIRKLLSVGLCSAGMLALVGAGEVQAQEANQFLPNYAPVGYIPVDFLPDKGVSLTDPSTVGTVTSFATVGTATVEKTAEEQIAEEVDVVLEGVDHNLVVNGVPVSENVQRQVVKGVTYVSLLDMAKEMDETAKCSWNPNTKNATVTTEHLSLSAVGGQLYLVANGRYLYIEETVQQKGDDLLVPLHTLMRAFDAQLFWNGETGITSVITGSGGIVSGDSFYQSDNLFWLSRVVFAESGNQPLEGQMGVAMVVMNRVNRSAYPNTILGVISQQNQFSVYQNGALANRTPNASSIVAAKLVMDGGIVAELKNATHFDSLSVSWASRNLTRLAKIGGHSFYG